ncbi:MAG TPA: flagellar basal body P-ring formation chaperone FlgA [Rhodanobacteraceae bacterium]|jgi:flagella basal body P-ring formation protein FlgA|nr:flagellar basal body P-ring formation chaperone FlgA [Rhodanobacteraceae bacterium]
MKRMTVAATLLIAMAGTVHAAAVQPLPELQATAVQAVRQAAPAGARVVAEAEALDSRLRLPACSGELQVEAPDLGRGSSRVSVAVSCAVGASWTVRVPVRVQIFRKVLVSSRALARGDVINNGDVRAEEQDVARLGYGYLADSAEVYGRHLRRPVGADTVLTPGMLTAREVVQRGQQVSLVARMDGILVRAGGVALQAGDRGDLVRVRSLSCDCVVQGKVRDPGVVETLP